MSEWRPKINVVSLATSLIVSIFGICGVIVTYWFTKKRELEADLRKEKLCYYKALIESLSGIIVDEATPEGQEAFSRAGNNLLLFAPQPVIECFYKYREGIRGANDDHDRLLTDLFLAIRHDLGINSSRGSSFTARLWSSGVRPESP